MNVIPPPASPRLPPPASPLPPPGHHSTLLADGLIGVLTGSAALGYSCCCLLPLMGYALGGLLGNGPTVFADADTHTGAFRTTQQPRGGARAPEGREWSSRKAVLGLLLATSLGAVVWVSVAGGAGDGFEPYDESNPRRVTITHLHETGSWLPEVCVGWGPLLSLADRMHNAKRVCARAQNDMATGLSREAKVGVVSFVLLWAFCPARSCLRRGPHPPSLPFTISCTLTSTDPLRLCPPPRSTRSSLL